MQGQAISGPIAFILGTSRNKTNVKNYAHFYVAQSRSFGYPELQVGNLPEPLQHAVASVTALPCD